MLQPAKKHDPLDGESAGLTESVPAVVQCARCQHRNAQPRRFCRDCGEALRFPCHECDADQAVDERFCGDCGADIAEFLAATADSLKALCGSVEEHLSLRDYTAASTLLDEHEARRHPVLHTLSDRLRELREQVQIALKSATEQAENNLEVAKAFAESRRYHEAADALENIPVTGRTQKEIERLRTDIEQKLAAIQELREHVQDSLKQQKTIGLIAHVEAWRELQPHHPDLEKLIRKLVDVQIKAAQGYRRAHAYQQVSECLELIPDRLLGDSVRRLIAESKSLAYLRDELRHAPYVDRYLQIVAKKLWDCAGESEWVQTCCQKLKQKLQRSAKSAEPLSTWAPPPEQPYLGISVRRYAPQVETKAAPNTDGRASKTEFASYGLALQAIGAATINTSLLPQTRGGLKERLQGLVRSRRKSGEQFAEGWGIEISSTGLKATQLARSGDRLEVVQSIALALQPSSSSAPDQTLLAAHCVQQFLDKVDLDADARIAVGVSGIHILHRSLVLPATSKDKLAAAVQFEAKACIPFDLSEVLWDYHVFPAADGSPRKSGAEGRHACLIAVKEWRIDELLRPFRDAEIDVHAMQSGCLAVANALLYGENLIEDIAIVDIGHETTDLIVVGPNRCWSRSWGQGIKQCIDALVRGFKLTRTEATRVFLQPETAPALYEMMSYLEAAYQPLEREIQLSLTEYNKFSKSQRPTSLMVIGGGAQAPGLLRYLTHGPLARSLHSASG